MTAYEPRAGLARRKASAALVLASLLAACAGTQKPAPQAPMPIAPPAPAPVPPMPMPPIAMMPPPSAMLQPDAAMLRASYGAPDFVRREMESELWRYDVAKCAVFFFLYRDGSAMRVRYVETAPKGADRPADPACLESLSARAHPMS